MLQTRCRDVQVWIERLQSVRSACTDVACSLCLFGTDWTLESQITSHQLKRASYAPAVLQKETS